MLELIVYVFILLALFFISYLFFLFIYFFFCLFHCLCSWCLLKNNNHLYHVILRVMVCLWTALSYVLRVMDTLSREVTVKIVIASLLKWGLL